MYISFREIKVSNYILLFVTLAYSNEQNIVTIYVDEMRVMFRYSLATWISEKG